MDAALKKRCYNTSERRQHMDQTLLIIFIAAIVLFILKGLMTEARNQRNETRRCPRCGSVIPYKARVCPACWNGINGRGLKTDWAAEGRLFRKSFDLKVAIFAIVAMAICVGLMWLIS